MSSPQKKGVQIGDAFEVATLAVMPVPNPVSPFTKPPAKAPRRMIMI